MADRLEAEAQCIGACERLQKLAKEIQAEAKKIVDYGTIPDNGGHSMGQVKDGMRNLDFHLGINSADSRRKLEAA